jgi:hypothetical protein
MAKEEGAPYSMGDAIVSDNMGFTLKANFYIRHKKTLRPTKLFKNESDGVDWLRKFI